MRTGEATNRLPLNCPTCGLRLDYVRWEGGTHFYRCQRHGTVVLTRDGQMREDDRDQPLVVH